MYLYDYEVGFICNLIKNNKPRTIKFNNQSYFIADYLSLNEAGRFSKPFYVFYTHELQAKSEDHGFYTTFLDLDLNVLDSAYK